MQLKAHLHLFLASSNFTQLSSSNIIYFQCGVLKGSLGCSNIVCKTVFLLLKCKHLIFLESGNCLIVTHSATQSLSCTSCIYMEKVYRMRKIWIVLCQRLAFIYSHIGSLKLAFSFLSQIDSATKNYINHNKLLVCEKSSRKSNLGYNLLELKFFS